MSLFYEALNDVSGRFCGGAEKWWGFAPSHLERVWDHYFGVINVADGPVGGLDVAKIPRIFVADRQPPKPIFDVYFGENKRLES